MNSKEDMFVDYTHITLERRLVPFLVAFVLFLMFVACMIGYFLGVKHTTDEFITQIRQETMADQLLMTAQASAPQPPLAALQEEIATTPPVAASVIVAEVPKTLEQQVPQQTPTEPVIVTGGAPEKISPPMRYAAELIGFGTKNAAETFIKQVAAYSTTPLILKERTSKSPRGRRINWYQVVTDTYDKKEELQQFLDLLIKKEHLHDIKIVAYAATKKDSA